ncbi:GntR family transcriptional regulator [Burkholderia cepacia]|uniref:GntR family transcriptional regulator n=1 Tax=Burkholderia cepacia TaxID=292 RepID=UPI00298FE007|nr:GntR family transcriptional regulator [Burkholderia cepacia]
MQSLAALPRGNFSLRQRVVERLRDAILDGTLAPGQKLVEKDLCAQLDVSRSLLRESLQQLQAEGLITNIVHRGPSVATITREEACEIYEVRRSLETLAANAFARNASTELVQLLRQKLETLKQLGPGSTSSLLEAKNAFYATLIDGCGNRLVGQILTVLNNRVTVLRRLSLSTEGRLDETLNELEGVVQAIETRQPEQAGLLCATHVQNAERTMLRQFPESTVDDSTQRPS